MVTVSVFIYGLKNVQKFKLKTKLFSKVGFDKAQGILKAVIYVGRKTLPTSKTS